MFRTLIRIAALGFAASAFRCEPKTRDFFFPEVITPATGTLSGLVSSGGTPLSGATVALGGTTRSTTTGATGTYLFTDVLPNTYTVTASANTFSCPPVSATVVINQTATANIVCTPLPGNIAGTVRVDNVGQAGITVNVAPSGGGATTTTSTGAGGTYTVPNLSPGSYTVSVSATGINCPGPQTVTVQSTQTAIANFDCASPPRPGSVTGLVRVDNVAQAGIVVNAVQNGATAGTALTAADGTYTISNLAAGTFIVSAVPPQGGTCSAQQNVTVPAGGSVTANFDCTSGDFAINLTTSYRNIVVGSSEACVAISTTPPRPNAIFTATWTGPGIVGTGQRTANLDGSGTALDRQAINAQGSYSVTVQITAGGITRSATASVTVTAAAGTCSPP